MGNWLISKKEKLDPVCFFYLPYSGGKFLANCLALSKDVLCMKEPMAKEDIYWSGPVDAEYYNFKLKSILTSLPPNFSEMNQWKKFELSDNLTRIANNPLINKRIICHTAHNNDELETLITKYPNIRVVKLVNYRRFNKLCCKLKSSTLEIGRHITGYSHWDQNSSSGHFNFDVDTVYSVVDFLAEMKRLYNFLELEDFQSELVQKFHRAYADCHGLT